MVVGAAGIGYPVAARGSGHIRVTAAGGRPRLSIRLPGGTSAQGAESPMGTGDGKKLPGTGGASPGVPA